MGATLCPNCGNDVPAETGQHALTPVAGLVQCPHCGAEVKLGDDSAGATEGRETFAGEETIEGVKNELSEKEGGPG